MEAVQAVDGRGKKRWAALAVIVAVIVFGLATAAWALGRDDASATGTVTLGAAVDDVQPIPGFPARNSPATTSVDGSLFVFGGYLQGSSDFRDDGILVNPGFTTAKHLPEAPFDAPLWTPKAVGVDGQVVVVGVGCDVVDHTDNDSDTPNCVPATNAAAVIDLRDGRTEWRRVTLPKPLASIRFGGANSLGATSDGRAVFEFGPFGRQTFWSFDPRTDAWDQIAGPGGRIDRSCLVDDSLLVMAASDPTQGQPQENPTIASLDLTGTGTGVWAHSPSAPVFHPGGAELSCIADGAFVQDGAIVTNNRTYSLTSREWSELPAPPSRAYVGARVWTGSELVFFPSEAQSTLPAMVLAPSTRSWRTVSGFPAAMRGAFWGGTAIVGYAEPLRVTGPTEEGGQAATAPAGVYRYDVPAG